MKKLSLIVPCYNEEEALPAFYDEVTGVMASMSEDYDYELLLVNDGSRDGTLELMRRLAAEDSRVRYCSFSRNFGKESAMYAGLSNADGDYVAVLDADLQDPPSLLPRMCAILEEGEYDAVATRRSDRVGESPVRSFFARSFYRIINKISDADVMDGARDFRLMRREVVDAILAMGEYNRFSKGIFGWIGFRTYWIDFENVERVAGETKWSFWGLLKYAIDGIIDFSQTPLSLVSWGGLVMTMLSMLALVVIVVRRLVFGDPVAGWASTVCIIVFLNGLQMFSLGVLGQYIARIYLETKHRPHYIISETNLDDVKGIG